MVVCLLGTTFRLEPVVPVPVELVVAVFWETEVVLVPNMRDIKKPTKPTTTTPTNTKGKKRSGDFLTVAKAALGAGGGGGEPLPELVGADPGAAGAAGAVEVEPGRAPNPGGEPGIPAGRGGPGGSGGKPGLAPGTPGLGGKATGGRGG